MNVRWLKALSILAAAGATAAVVGKSRRGGLSPAPEAALPDASVTPPEARRAVPEVADAEGSTEAQLSPAQAVPEEAAAAGPEPARAPDAPAAEAPAVVVTASRLPEEAAGNLALGTAAREAAVLFAYDAAAEQAAEGERVVVLAVAGVKVAELAAERAEVVVPLELSHRGGGHVPHTRSATLHVSLNRTPQGWQVCQHRWE